MKSRRNGWQLVEQPGEGRPEGVSRLLNFVRWDAEAVHDKLRAHVVEQLGDPSGVLLTDETDFLNEEGHQVGRRPTEVQWDRRAPGELPGRCVPEPFQPRGPALGERELYLPNEWADDAAYRQEAEIPAAVAFATKLQLALLWRFLRSAGDLPSDVAARDQNRPPGCWSSSGPGIALDKAIRGRHQEDARVALGAAPLQLTDECWARASLLLPQQPHVGRPAHVPARFSLPSSGSSIPAPAGVISPSTSAPGRPCAVANGVWAAPGSGSASSRRLTPWTATCQCAPAVKRSVADVPRCVRQGESSAADIPNTEQMVPDEDPVSYLVRDVATRE